MDVRIISATTDANRCKIKQQALWRGVLRNRVYKSRCIAGAHVTESLLSQTPAPPHKTGGSWLRLAVDESLGVEQRLPNSFHLFSS